MAHLKEQISKQEYDYIINQYKNNISIRKISEELHHSRMALSNLLEEAGVKTAKGNHYRYYNFNQEFFKTIESEKQAYWLGFMYADGCILSKGQYGEQDFKLALSIVDEQSIIDFKHDLDSEYPIRYDTSRHDKNPKHQIQVFHVLRSQKTVDDLKRLGCVEKKSLILKFPTKEQVPEKFIWHFIRGYFDGDGSVINYKENYQVSFVGTENFIKGLFKVIKMGSVFPDKRKENSWYLNIGGNIQMLEFYHKLYDNSTRFMQRKFDKFQPLLQKYGKSQGI